MGGARPAAADSSHCTALAFALLTVAVGGEEWSQAGNCTGETARALEEEAVGTRRCGKKFTPALWQLARLLNYKGSRCGG